MKQFWVVWFGQTLSLLGSQMTQFALIVTITRSTGNVTDIGWMIALVFLPMIITYPFAGLVIDRMPIRTALIFSDSIGALGTLVIALFIRKPDMLPNAIKIAMVFSGISQAFHAPAYTVFTSHIVPSHSLTRINGMKSLSREGSNIIGPAVGGVILFATSLWAIVSIDFFSFFVAITTLLIMDSNEVRDFERIRKSSKKALTITEIFQNLLYGFRRIFGEKRLLHVQLFLLVGNLAAAFTPFLLPGLVLSRFSVRDSTLGLIQGAIGIGGASGALLMAISNNSKKPLYGIGIAMAISGFLGMGTLAIVRNINLMVMGAFFFAVGTPIVNSLNQTFWQRVVPLNEQGKVISTKSMMALFTVPLSTIVASKIADRASTIYIGLFVIDSHSLSYLSGAIILLSTGIMFSYWRMSTYGKRQYSDIL